MVKISGNKGLVSYIYKPSGDKSISHRAAIMGAISKEKLRIYNFAKSKDCLSTLECLRAIGVPINIAEEEVSILPFTNPAKTRVTLNCNNSGTTARLLPAILGGLGIEAILTGDESLSKRPMARVVEPLRKIGGNLESTNDTLPLNINKGWNIKGGTIPLDIASAQLKTAILLAGLFSEEGVTVVEKEQTRNHTEIIFREFGVEVEVRGKEISILSKAKLKSPEEYRVVGDFSSSAYFIALGLLSPTKIITVVDVGLNPTRTAFLEVVGQMGGKLKIKNKRHVNGELMGDIEVFPSELVGVELDERLVPNLIDELPLIAVLATFAKGKTKVVKANELRVKESDRITAIIDSLTLLGADAKELEDGFEIWGGKKLKGTEIYCHNDHRIIMSMAVAALFVEGETTIIDSSWVGISNSSFFDELNQIAPESIF